MPNVLIFLSVGLPLLMTAAAIATIHRMRERERTVESNTWRDTSLDDWRQERDSQIEAERLQRASERSEALAAGREEEVSEPIRQQRIGG